MKRNTIKWRIFKYNIIVIIMLITFTAVIFNVAVRIYIEKNIVTQLNKIASNAEDTALKHGPDFFKQIPPPPPPDSQNIDLPPFHAEDTELPLTDIQGTNDLFKYYFMLDHSLKEPLTLLNADFILIDQNENRITPFTDKYVSDDFMKQLKNEINNSKKIAQETYLTFRSSGTEYIAIIKPVSDKNSFGLGWIIIYSNVEQINQLQISINLILFFILIFSALITVVFSSRVSKKISEPFYHLNQYISAISERNFGNKIEMPVYDELRELVNNINIMSEKLETYDKAQKTFLQNASHEFRTPLMSIQSYAEGIKYEVVDSNNAVTVILSEIKRMTRLVEDLLYLSRLNAIEENYNYVNLDFNALTKNCVTSVNLLAEKSNITLRTKLSNQIIQIYGDEEKLSRAITNVINNCIRYANSIVTIELITIDKANVQLVISDDGPGFKNSELPNIFERFYKGVNGNLGLGLSISKNIIEKLNGQISAKNSTSGALFIIELPISF
jgi:signal transduction histidine kinase